MQYHIPASTSSSMVVVKSRSSAAWRGATSSVEMQRLPEDPTGIGISSPIPQPPPSLACRRRSFGACACTPYLHTSLFCSDENGAYIKLRFRDQISVSFCSSPPIQNMIFTLYITRTWGIFVYSYTSNSSQKVTQSCHRRERICFSPISFRDLLITTIL